MENYVKHLKPVRLTGDIPKSLRHTPFASLFGYHNLGLPFKTYTSAKLLVCMCMDNRKQLRLPDNFAYILRTGGGNIRYSEFKISYAVGIGGVRHIVMIAHDNCGMVNLASRRGAFVDGLMRNAGWTQKKAMDYFVTYAPLFEIGNEIDFVLAETRRLALKYPKVKVLPTFYRLSDGKLYLIKQTH
jgi:carbonic anhydrase